MVLSRSKERSPIPDRTLKVTGTPFENEMKPGSEK
jgi:hypothetical protein